MKSKKEHSSIIKPAKKILLSEDGRDRGDYSEIAKEKLIEGEKRYLHFFFTFNTL